MKINMRIAIKNVTISILTTEYKMKFYYDIIPHNQTSIYETIEAIEEATQKALLVNCDAQKHHTSNAELPMGVVRLDEREAAQVNKLNLSAKLVKCEGQQ